MSTFLARNSAITKPIAPIAAPGTVAPGGPFTLNPATQPGVGPYGTVPGPIGKPPSLYQGAQSIYPGLANLTTAAGGNIAHELAGDFSPQTENALWDTANRFGVASGMPGSQLWSNRFMGNVAGAKEKLQQQGQQDYGAFLGNLAKTTDDPNLLAQIAARNATMASAPNPEQAAQALAEAYRRAQLDAAGRARGPAGGTANPYFTSPASGTVPKANPFAAPTANPALTGWHDPGMGAGGNISDAEWNQLAYGLYPELDSGVGSAGGGTVPTNTYYNPQTDTSNYNPFGDPYGLYGGGAGYDQGGSLDQVATGNNYDPNANMSDEEWWNYLNGFGG
jgi:hypothetical protein